MNWRDRIVIDPQVLIGKPTIRGSRISVEFVVELLAAGWREEQVWKATPTFPNRTFERASPTQESCFERSRFIP